MNEKMYSSMTDNTLILIEKPSPQKTTLKQNSDVTHVKDNIYLFLDVVVSRGSILRRNPAC